MYTTQGVDISIRNCTFQYSIEPSAYIQQSMVYINGKVIEFYGQIKTFNPNPESYLGLIDIFYFGQAANLFVNTSCPQWYNHFIDYTTASSGIMGIPDIKYKCRPCIPNHYTTHIGSNTLSFYGNDNITFVESLHSNQGVVSCEQCPYGAFCTGNNVMPRPNYWGYWFEGKRVFQQCPAEYCCPNTKSSTCNVYNYCPNNRTGTLCGACKQHFSVAILTGSCTPDSQCGRDQWFWLVVILAAMGYASWYTLKDDMFALFFCSTRFIKKTCTKSNLNATDAPLELVSAKWKINNEHHNGVFKLQSSDMEKTCSSSLHNISDTRDTGENSYENVGTTGSNDDVDKGYFGIVTYYVQMVAVITIQIQ